MSDLSGSERRNLERLLGMGSGYVLDFSDRTFGEFFDEYRVEIDAERYKAQGTSKAKRMRAFWDIDENHIVGRVISGLINYAIEQQCFSDSNPLLIENCRKIAQRLLIDQPVAELDALTAIANERDFEVVAEHVREAIEKKSARRGIGSTAHICKQIYPRDMRTTRYHGHTRQATTQRLWRVRKDTPRCRSP